MTILESPPEWNSFQRGKRGNGRDMGFTVVKNKQKLKPKTVKSKTLNDHKFLSITYSFMS